MTDLFDNSTISISARKAEQGYMQLTKEQDQLLADFKKDCIRRLQIYPSYGTQKHFWSKVVYKTYTEKEALARWDANINCEVSEQGSYFMQLSKRAVYEQVAKDARRKWSLMERMSDNQFVTLSLNEYNIIADYIS